VLLVVTGLPSSGKARLVNALAERFGSTNILVGVLPGLDASVLHVHAETDVDAFVEGSGARDAARAARVVVPVDWEPVERSVERVAATLAGG
jgi:hypothetical protein